MEFEELVSGIDFMSPYGLLHDNNNFGNENEENDDPRFLQEKRTTPPLSPSQTPSPSPGAS